MASFTEIQLGPFASTYHRNLEQADLRSALCNLLESEVLPQVQEPFDSTSGKLTAAFDDDRHTGANSAVRNLFQLELSLNRESGADVLKARLRYDPHAKSFSSLGAKLYLWTVARKQRFESEEASMRRLCSDLTKDPAAEAICPRCGARLHPHVTPALVDIACPSACFQFGFHRVPETGEFLHGHFRQSDPNY